MNSLSSLKAPRAQPGLTSSGCGDQEAFPGDLHPLACCILDGWTWLVQGAAEGGGCQGQPMPVSKLG